MGEMMNKVRLQRKTSSLRVGDHQDRIPVKLNQDRHRVLTYRKSKSLKWIFQLVQKLDLFWPIDILKISHYHPIAKLRSFWANYLSETISNHLRQNHLRIRRYYSRSLYISRSETHPKLAFDWLRYYPKVELNNVWKPNQIGPEKSWANSTRRLALKSIIAGKFVQLDSIWALLPN